MTLAERLNQFNLVGQMIRVVWPEAMQFIQQFLGDNLGLDVFHPMDHAVSHRPDRFETMLLFEPIHQEIRGRFVIGGGEAAAVRLFPGWVIECQICPAQADAINLSIKPSLQRFFDMVKRELDAR